MIEFCKAAELANENMKVIATRSEHRQACAVKSQRRDQEEKCYKCGGLHGSKKTCPALGKTCYRCKRQNHFTTVCRASPGISGGGDDKAPPARTKACQQVGLIQEEAAVDYYHSKHVSSVCKVCNVGVNNGDRFWFAKISINGHTVNFKLDSGSEVDILPLRYATETGLDKVLVPSSIRLEAYGGFSIKPIGEAFALIKHNQVAKKVSFVIIDNNNATPILSLKTCVALGLIKRVSEVLPALRTREDYFNYFKDSFEVVGCFPDRCTIKLTDDAKPYACSARRLPLKLKERFKEHLTDLESRWIIEKVDDPQEWVSNVVVLEKPNGSLRMCIDPWHLNKYIVRERVTTLP